MKVRWEVFHVNDNRHLLKLKKDDKLVLLVSLDEEEWQQLLNTMSVEMM